MLREKGIKSNNMTNEKIFLELLNSLENDKNLFLSGILHTEVEFLNNIHKLQKYIPHIQDSQIKEKVDKFVNSVINSKNYSIILKTIKEDKIRKEKQKIAKQKRLEAERKSLALKQQIIYKQQQKQQETLNIISDINIALNHKELKTALTLYKNNYDNIALYNYNFLTTMSSKMEIIEFVLKRKIKKLIHFTNIQNLQSILNLGILPRNVLNEKNIVYKYTDEKRFDGRPDCTCLSIEYPNFRMLHYKKYNSVNRYAMIVLDAESILSNDAKKYYVYINAANSNATYQLTSDKLTSPRYLKNMFLPIVSDAKYTYEREDTDPDFITTNPQTEILINGSIETKDILEVHFSNSDDFNLFKKSCTSEQILNEYKFLVSDFYFKEDRELVKWEER